MEIIQTRTNIHIVLLGILFKNKLTHHIKHRKQKQKTRKVNKCIDYLVRHKHTTYYRTNSTNSYQSIVNSLIEPLTGMYSVGMHIPNTS